METCPYICKSIVLDKIHTFIKKQTNKQAKPKQATILNVKAGKGLEHNTGQDAYELLHMTQKQEKKSDKIIKINKNY